MSADRPSYYGAFFWIALLSFSVPIVVAARAFNEVRVASKPTPQPDASGVDQAVWDYLLKTYVSAGLVDYEGLKRDYLFPVYLQQLAAADSSKLATDADRLAFLCNAYNAFVINGVISHKISDNVMKYKQDEKGFFDIDEHILQNRTVSLNTIEHQLIRQPFQEPRIHVALVCAAVSCPAIRPEAYVGERIDEQLEDQSIQFANNAKYVKFDAASDTLLLSPLLSWYGDDWLSVGGYLPWLAGLVDDPKLVASIQRVADGKGEVKFMAYDWSLNSQSPTAGGQNSGTSGKKAEFGSGSIPNE